MYICKMIQFKCCWKDSFLTLSLVLKPNLMQSDFGLNKLDKKQKVSSQSSKNRPFCQTLELCLKTGQRR